MGDMRTLNKRFGILSQSLADLVRCARLSLGDLMHDPRTK